MGENARQIEHTAAAMHAHRLPFPALALVLTAALLPATDAAARGKRVLLKVPVAYATDLPALGTPIAWVADRLREVSGGSVRMKVYEPDRLVAPFEILDAVSRGKVNAGYATAGYWAGKIPAAPLFTAVPFGPEAGEFMAWLYHDDGLDLWQEMYRQAGYHVHPIPCAIIAPETSGWFREPIDDLEDLKGLRMRFYGLGARVMERLGASTSVLPGGQVFSAMEKGLVDATEFSQPAIDQRLGLHKVAKYNYFPGWHQQATVFELLINADTWADMEASQRALIELTCQASMARSFAEGEAMQFRVMRENAQRRGVENRIWSDQMLAAFRAAWDEVVAEEVARDPFFAKVWKDLSAFRAGYDLWEAYAFLPRPLPEDVAPPDSDRAGD
jgi:TRAP-type mannitol/chloroaromatic compound transport system substrate-binding protein